MPSIMTLDTKPFEGCPALHLHPVKSRSPKCVVGGFPYRETPHRLRTPDYAGDYAPTTQRLRTRKPAELRDYAVDYADDLISDRYTDYAATTHPPA